MLGFVPQPNLPFNIPVGWVKRSATQQLILFPKRRSNPLTISTLPYKHDRTILQKTIEPLTK
ncbi:hypothetical protein ACN4EE_13615 [Geminocystis sp. CENA526]|uniref:hypothetical protein n=1 Tax=Geminocystis sp. CENA526 TaxID=1355871 RepID=UPI003D6E1439